MVVGPGTNFCAIWSSADAGTFAAGDGGTILSLQNDSWIAMNTGTTANINAVWGGPEGSVFAVGSKAYILRLIEAQPSH
jgi:hypothetical protein